MAFFAATDDEAQESPLKLILSQLGITITAQPTNQVGVIGGNATFGPVTVNDFYAGLVQYKWQIQTDGATWGDLVESTGFYENVATNTLTVKAIDNYLATRTSLNFRVGVFYPGTAPVFSNAASLTIAIHTDFHVADVGHGGRLIGTNNWNLSSGLFIPTVTGFAGPYTYLWTYVSGSTDITLPAPTNALPTFRYSAPITLGAHVAYWKCTITNGVTTIATDPMVVIAVGTSPETGYFNTPGNESSNGGGIPPVSGVFVSPWSPGMIAQKNVRRTGVTPSVTIDFPNSAGSTFSLNGPDIPGTAVVAYPACFWSGPSQLVFCATVWGAAID